MYLLSADMYRSVQNVIMSGVIAHYSYWFEQTPNGKYIKISALLFFSISDWFSPAGQKVPQTHFEAGTHDISRDKHTENLSNHLKMLQMHQNTLATT